MKKALVSISVATLLTAANIPAQAQENLIYVAVEPCRLVDTRNAGGAIPANTPRDFLVSGADLSSQGGTSCVHPRAGSGVDPVALSAYIVAVPTATSGPGLLTAFPADQVPADDDIATVNYAAQQVIGNTTNATLCENPASCTNGPLGIFTWVSEQNVVVDVQGYFYPATGTCPDDMVAVGSLCVDKYEASVTNAAGDTQYGLVSPPDYPCAASGRDCGAAGSNPAIYARSVAGTTPSAYISWWQAAQACVNVGKRLPTSAEWQAAASGTPSGDGVACNVPGSVAATGSFTSCVSSAGAFDMIGNLWEWVADMDNPALTGFTSTNSFQAWSMGDSFNGLGDASTRALWVDALGNTSSRRGLRCVR